MVAVLFYLHPMAIRTNSFFVKVFMTKDVPFVQLLLFNSMKFLGNPLLIYLEQRIQSFPRKARLLHSSIKVNQLLPMYISFTVYIKHPDLSGDVANPFQ